VPQHDDATEASGRPRESTEASVGTDTILDHKMSTLHRDPHAVTFH
jgi:hypothetical protein